MIYFGLFLAELIALFYLSRRVQKAVSALFLSLTKSRKITVYLLSLLFLPGTLIHELSHALFSIFLLVGVGDLVIIPEIEGESVRMGSVSIAKTDPVRRFLIGIAPLIIGTGIILTLIYLLILGKFTATAPIIAIFYLIFAVSNTMFLSKKDLEGAWKVFLITVIIYLVYYLAGFDFHFNFNGSVGFEMFFKKASLYIAAPSLLDFLILAVFRIFDALGIFKYPNLV